MTVLNLAKDYKYIAMTFDEVKYPTPVNSHLIGSNDGIKWKEIKKYDFGWRDPSIIQIDNVYYIAVGEKINRTEDFNSFDNDVITLPDSDYAHWASEFFRDKDGNVKIVSAINKDATNPDGFSLRSYNIDFKALTVTIDHDIKGNWEVGSPIDPNITVVNDQLVLFVSESDKRIHQYTANDLDDTFEPVKSNLVKAQGDTSNEAPELLLLRDKAILYCDPWFDEAHRQLHYMTADLSMDNWSTPAAITGLDYRPRHFGIIETGEDPLNQGRPVIQIKGDEKDGYALTHWEAITNKPDVAERSELNNYQKKHGTSVDQLPEGTTIADMCANIKDYCGEWVNTKYVISDAPDGKGTFCSINLHKATNLTGGYILYIPFDSGDIWYAPLNGALKEWTRLTSHKIRNYTKEKLELSQLIPAGGRVTDYLILDCQVSGGPHGYDADMIATLKSSGITDYTGTQQLHIVSDNSLYVRSYAGNPRVFSAWKTITS
ncbi:hypothetical protein [Pediococcus pentosaceus]|uniref:Uncharacterized protein n=5 Tax=Pediococcus pentosaceus TaxID=1255 RepID=A0A6L5A3J6_PEDPE|nr:hypothetical protein [Pediococcus pentosaceus]KAF0415085.1 hypothetical protein GBO79_01840 [Pediococcus pentosaceus]KAF0502766.1 hypothetical protein GBP22_05160 [Pediococcus pentosaceus]MBF7126451.1 hypothetical protein [Pediococcus pentosaceus]